MTPSTPQPNQRQSIRNSAGKAAMQARDVRAETINISQDREEHDVSVTFTHNGTGDQMWEKTVHNYGNAGEERSLNWGPHAEVADSAINGVIQSVQESEGYKAVEFGPVTVALSNLKAAVQKQDQSSAAKHYMRARELVRILCPEVSEKLEGIAPTIDAAFSANRDAKADSDG